MIQIQNSQIPSKELFPQEIVEILSHLHRDFEPQRQTLLQTRQQRQREFDQGQVPKYLSDHPALTTEWSVAPLPRDLLDRRVEITGPVSSAKMVINMLSENSEGDLACTAMLDFEDSMAPTWSNVVAGIQNILGVAHQTLSFTQGDKVYRLNPDRMALPMIRVRGLHLLEKNVTVDGAPISAGLFDLAMTVYHTSRVFLSQGKTPKFYIPKTEHFLEARWWNQVFQALESRLELKRGTLRATFLIETLPASFQMEEILYEVRERVCGLNGGRWDKIFSDIKTLKMHKDRVLANRGSIDMTRPWMDNYAKLLIKICHKHGAFAMGGMSAFTPGKDPATRSVQIEKVIADKRRESQNGHDGCWVSHPFFIGPAKQQFQKMNQLDVLLKDFPDQPDLLPQSIGPKTLAGLRQNVRVGIVYQQGWDQGLGCVSFENLMEDLATLEISRAQVWQWLHHRVQLDDGTIVTAELVKNIFSEELPKVCQDLQVPVEQQSSFATAKEKISSLFTSKELADFFTLMSI